jgi:hypothetical protein
VEKCLGAASAGQLFGASLLGTVIAGFVTSEAVTPFLGGFENWSETNRLKESLTLMGNEEALDDDADDEGDGLGEVEPD